MKTDENEDSYIAWPFWGVNSKTLYFQWMNRGQDHIKIFGANPQTGIFNKVYSETQKSWVEFFEDIYALQDGSGFILRTNKSGWSHLYLYNINGKLKKQLTKGKWSVKSIAKVDEKNKQIFFMGSKDNSVEQYLYKVNFKGKHFTKLTTEPGTHYCNVSTSGKLFIDTYSNISTPYKSLLKDKTGKIIKALGDSKLSEMDEYALGKTELFTIPSGDGYNLPAVWILPPNFDENKKYPVIISIYGGPGAASVRNFFQRLSRYYLAQQGIICLTVDHRGSGHFGKEGMALMHRCLSKWEMHDYIAAVKWLKEKSYVDSLKIGINGGSYGGYVTSLALTYGADYFTHGIADFSVTDWRLYDNVYTERYMDTPEENPEGYENSSVMKYADKLKGKFLITHGTMDDNVHMQNTIQLIDKFQQLDKNFEFMLYPNQRHGYRGRQRFHYYREQVEFWLKHFFGRELNFEE